MERITLKELFLEAVQEGNIDKLRSCSLGADAWLVSMEKTLKELFLQAVQEGNFDKIGPCINLGGDAWFLSIAIQRGQIDMLKILLQIPSIDLNADRIVGMNNGLTIAQIAVKSEAPGSIECLELLSRDTRVNWNITYRDNEDAPLLYVLKNRKSEMFKIMMTVPSIDFSVLENHMDPFILDCLRQVPHLTSRVATPECPICYERFSRNDQVFLCNQGHFVCHRCYQRINNCPKCRGQIIGRAHDFEHFIQGLNI